MWFDHLAEICERRKAGIKKAAATTTTKKSRLTGFHFIYTMDKMITFLNVFKNRSKDQTCIACIGKRWTHYKMTVKSNN